MLQPAQYGTLDSFRLGAAQQQAYPERVLDAPPVRHQARETYELASRALLRTRRWRFSGPLMRTLRRVGERFEVEWLIYNPLTFAYWHSKAVESASIVADALERELPQAQTYADLGAGTGAFAAELHRRGKVVIAYERSRLGRLVARSQRVPALDFNLERLSAVDFAAVDVVMCFEVAEHLCPQLGDTLVRLCAAKGSIVVFTAAAPGQGGAGHLNEQPKSYWIERFERCGSHFDQPLTNQLERGFAGATAFWIAENLMVFRRAAAVGPRAGAVV